MRQFHVAGNRRFVDHAGATLELGRPKTGERPAVPIFIATLGAANDSYVDAT